MPRIAYLVPSSESRQLGRLAGWERIALGVLGGLLLVLLFVASRLAPDPQGLGTHQQLGLPSCSMVMLTGLRCPGCGMTTAWAHCMRGQWGEAMGANVAGTLLCLLSILCAPVLIAYSWLGRTWRSPWFSTASLGVLSASLAIAIFEWLIRLASAV